MDLLREEMADDRVDVRINAVHRAGIIAAAFRDIVDSELVPYLIQLIGVEDDEVLFAIAAVLGTF